MLKIVRIFRQISRGLTAEFTTARQIEHKSESGRATEDALRALLRRHLPSRFEVTGGLVVGKGGVISGQSDILIIDALNCPRFLQTLGTGLYPIEGVVARIEVTQNLTYRKRGQDLEKIRKFRNIRSTFSYTADFHDSAPLGFIFAESSRISLKSHANWLAREWRNASSKKKGGLPNCIFILDKGIVFYRNSSGGLHFDPCDATGVVILEDRTTALLIWLVYTLHKCRILLEHRIRARAREILSIRARGRVKNNEPIVQFLLDGSGAEPYFPDLVQYFTVGDLKALRRVVSRVHVIPL